MEAGDGGGVAEPRRSKRALWESSVAQVDRPAVCRRPPALNLPGGRLCQRMCGPRRRYCVAILLHCASAACLSEAIGIFAAAVRQACFALLSALFTFASLVVI